MERLFLRIVEVHRRGETGSSVDENQGPCWTVKGGVDVNDEVKEIESFEGKRHCEAVNATVVVLDAPGGEQEQGKGKEKGKAGIVENGYAPFSRVLLLRQVPLLPSVTKCNKGSLLYVRKNECFCFTFCF